MEHLIRAAADGLLLVILAVSGAAGGYSVVMRQRAVRQIAPVAIMAAMTSLLVAKLVSLVYQPHAVRPYVEKGLEAGAAYIDNPGFPSDHALLATVVVVLLYMVTPYKKLALFLAGLIILMSIARVLALVHTPEDVIGGIVIGCVGAVWYRQLPKAR